jgi:AAA domain
MNEDRSVVEADGTKESLEPTEAHSSSQGTEGCDPSHCVIYEHRAATEAPRVDGEYRLKMPNAAQLLAATFKKRRHLLSPWLREHENCMVYAATGIGKSLFALSASLAVAGNADFLGWRPDAAPEGRQWRVFYIDGEMHIADIQDRLRQLQDGMEGLDKARLGENLILLARQHQDAGVQFPSITEHAGQQFVLKQIRDRRVDMVVLDNFSTLGEVEDENAAASFNAIQSFLLQLKVQQVATMLVHHTGKAEDNFRGSSKLAATFETIIQLERPEVAHNQHAGWKIRTLAAAPGGARFRVKWDKVRSGSLQPKSVMAQLEIKSPKEFGGQHASWEYVETATSDRLDELAELLPAGTFATKKEIADYYDVTPPAAGKYIERGIRLGLWNEENISRWLGLGKRKRTEGKTEPPVRPDGSWKMESDVDEGSPVGDVDQLDEDKALDDDAEPKRDDAIKF